eukprot:CAMPEP_0116132028 /NCGR_PEP_ID=MMETSP0329-20121206/9329_1 /TAXON_ID=697910 /ORGANISM="Pseudo-nitzschia arenysensis, Strain B593" /LENGTH=561 /DNA_ID=CAMNT_0003626515 /DNA_START=205 /DNA_END=1890 /DNA_ORIENTATION=+
MTRLSDTVWNYSNALNSHDEYSLDEDLDSQSNHSHYSFAESVNKPIVVGYAFGAKKMSTMGVVLAEASRVKVIHEEPQFDEDEEETLCCEDEHQEPSTLTSAALRGLEEGRNAGTALKSTIITLGNSNDTDLKHIVRYFRSNCSSAAASVSIASVGETTVSTPTTTNSGPLNFKQRRHNRGKFPVQISFVPLDPDQPIEEQHGGKFDLILHKLTEDILSCSLMQGNNNNNNNNKETNEQWQQDIDCEEIVDPSLRRVRSIRDYCHFRNPNCCLVDDPKHVQTLMSRSEIASVLQNCLKGIETTSGIPVKSPRYVVVPEHNDSTSHDLAQALRKQQELSTPLIVKPLIAAGTKQSHYMLIALKESAFTKLPPKSIVQEFVNHDATLYKVYVLGDFVNVYRRNSLPNLPSDVSHATVDLVKFDSQRPYPQLQDFGMEETSDADTSDNQTAPLVTREEVKPIVEALKKAFGLELFGFDILMGSDSGECFVVDVNYFPSYKEVPNFPSLLARYLTQRVLDQRRKGRRGENMDPVGAEGSPKQETCAFVDKTNAAPCVTAMESSNI